MVQALFFVSVTALYIIVNCSNNHMSWLCLYTNISTVICFVFSLRDRARQRHTTNQLGNNYWAVNGVEGKVDLGGGSLLATHWSRRTCLPSVQSCQGDSHCTLMQYHLLIVFSPICLIQLSQILPSIPILSLLDPESETPFQACVTGICGSSLTGLNPKKLLLLVS